MMVVSANHAPFSHRHLRLNRILLISTHLSIPFQAWRSPQALSAPSQHSYLRSLGSSCFQFSICSQYHFSPMSEICLSPRDLRVKRSPRHPYYGHTTGLYIYGPIHCCRLFSLLQFPGFPSKIQIETSVLYIHTCVAVIHFPRAPHDNTASLFSIK